MTDVEHLWNRVEAAKKHLGSAGKSDLSKIESLNAQVKEVHAGIGLRVRELERHRHEVSQLRQENEQLRRMLHRLLLAIEQRTSGGLLDQVKGLEGEVAALASMVRVPEIPAAPGESDSRWLHEIMERARVLTDKDAAQPRKILRAHRPDKAGA